MRHALVTWAALLLVACGGPRRDSRTLPETPPGPDAVATFDGGWLSLAEVEERASAARSPACLPLRRAAGGGSLDELVPCYREVAEELVLERRLLAGQPASERTPEALGERYPDLRQEIFVRLFRRRLHEEIEVGDDEVERRFAEHGDRYRRPGQLKLWNIFRRHEGSDAEHTLAFLRGLRERALAGEPFGALAREHSQSETRLRDGLVGTVDESKLPPRLARVAFALDEGGVSDPIPVSGGAVLLHVREIVPGADLGLEDVRQQIRRQLRVEKVESAVAERVAGVEPPEGSRILSPEELIAALGGEDGDTAVLEVSGVSLTSADLRRLAALPASARGEDLTAAARERLQAVYTEQLERQLLLVDLLETSEADFREEAEDLLTRAAIARWVDEDLEEEIRRRIDGDAGALRRYYDDHRARYQSPLRFKLRIWDVPFDADPPRQLERMEELRERMISGRLELAAAAGELGGSVRDLGWRGLDDLVDVLPGKARAYLTQAEPGGYSVPYQQDDALHLLSIEAREEPRLLAYEEVAGQVREDYLRRFQQRLAREVIESRLAEAGFVFDEDAVRRLLGGAVETPAGAPADPAG